MPTTGIIGMVRAAMILVAPFCDNTDDAIKDNGDHRADCQDGYANTCNQPARAYTHALWQGELHGYACSEHALFYVILPNLRLLFRIRLRRERDPPRG